MFVKAKFCFLFFVFFSCLRRTTMLYYSINNIVKFILLYKNYANPKDCLSGCAHPPCYEVNMRIFARGAAKMLASNRVQMLKEMQNTTIGRVL